MSNVWRISATSYYADWVTIPIIGCAAAIADVSYHGLTRFTAPAVALGAIGWSFGEYAMHRWAFHNPKLFRRAHWLHHIRPADYVGVPAWQTSGIFLLVLAALWGALGLDIGGSIFVGIASYYLCYIIAHDRIHHGPLPSAPGYWQRRRDGHMLHHISGREVNFGVATPVWDMLLGTHMTES